MSQTQSHTASDPDGDTASGLRLGVNKTYKLYINGKFPRTESGRSYQLKDAAGQVIANMCLGSRKDFREAVVAARAAQPGWAGASAYLRSQILYRVAEMLEGRASQLASELVATGSDPSEARAEVTASIDRLVYYAGWADKYQQVFSSVNPVASSHFNFSLPEPTGVVSVLAPELSGLLGLVSVVAPAIAGGNTVVVHASQAKAPAAITFGEVLHTSDVPAGVVNLITGDRAELAEHFASHMDVNAIVYADAAGEHLDAVRTAAVDNLKRVVHRDTTDWSADTAQGPYHILDTLEIKTTWHPVGT